MARVALLCVVTVAKPAGAAAQEPAPFVISVDGVTIDGKSTVTNQRRQSDVHLEAVDIQVKFDGLGVMPSLNISTAPVRAAYMPGETIRFLATFNYPIFIARREIRIYGHGNLLKDKPYVVLDVPPQGAASWRLPRDAPAEMDYVLRVYDRDGRYDETRPLALLRSDRILKSHESNGATIAPGLGEDRTAIRNIPVSGGAVTVYGKNIPEGYHVTAFDEEIPVDQSGAFVVQRILMPGTHGVDVSVLRNGRGLQFNRDIEIPGTEWFYIALADLTAGYRTGSNNIEAVKPGEYDDIYTRGRLAFYVKGKIKGKYLLTAAADTGDGKIGNMFKGLDAKDPRQYLKRIDPDDYYPVYGDDSTAVEDAPTRGKFYVRLERGPSHVMWGNFRSDISGTELLRSNRALYGASGVYRSEHVTSEGQARSSLNAYAAQPGTLPHRDVFRGTGGSAYFLKFQDITSGSESISVETRNATTGWVISRRTLKDADDYELDYVQGVLLLKAPVPASSIAGTENFVVADYEYTPAAGEADGYVVGGRAQQWFGDHVRAGLTGMTEKTGGADQKLYGADLRLQATPRTYVEGEIAQTRGPGFTKNYSADGGLTLQDTASVGSAKRHANAYRIAGRTSLEDLTHGNLKGSVAARYEQFEKGYASREDDIKIGKKSWGGDADVEISERVKTAATYSESHADDGSLDRDARGKINFALDEHVSLEPFARYSQKERLGTATEDLGKRGDLGIKGTYAWDEKTEFYVFGQGTVVLGGTRDPDHRGGVGGKRQLTEKIDVAGELSYGSLGPAARATIGYAPTADDRYYLGYTLDAERDNSASWPYDLTGHDLGSIVAGAKHRYSERWSVYGEDNYDMFGARRSLTQTYGVTFTPDAKWTISGGIEAGNVFDNTADPATGLENPDFARQAISLSGVYRGTDGFDGKLKGEFRFDDSDDNDRDVQSYLIAGAIGIKMSDDWRALASVDAVFSDATDSTRDGDYVEGSLGFAYRPAEGDRFNALGKYTYLYDLPGTDQVSVDGTTKGPAQRSHIVSLDANYDLTNKLTLGGKYGARVGERKDRDAGSDWESSIVQLGILRADIHIVHQWDALLEGRALWDIDAGTVDYGALAAVYRHLGENMKIGVGYNFGIFSDDLRDLVHDDRGVFINLIGKL